MSKSDVYKFAISAHKKLNDHIERRAAQLGILRKSINNDQKLLSSLSVNDSIARNKLIDEIQQLGFDAVIDEAAYTWFNRFCALRFMEVNDYLPTHIRIFSNEQGKFKPQILNEADTLDWETLDKSQIAQLKLNANDEHLYRILLTAQCNALSTILPFVFEPINDTALLLLPNNLLLSPKGDNPGSVLYDLVTMIPESDWNIKENGQVEIIGWLYQYYISERHNAVVDPLYGKQINKEDIAAATQLFTTDWVVRYLTDNSLGELWLQHYPASSIKDEMTYIISKNRDYIKTELDLTKIKILDPCMGSGHFLVYAFELLMKFYQELGIKSRDAVKYILKNNIYGLDIDPRAVQLGYFALMMMARKYDNRFFRNPIQPQVYAIPDGKTISDHSLYSSSLENADLYNSLCTIRNTLYNAAEFGSLIRPDESAQKALLTIQSLSNDTLFDNHLIQSAIASIQILTQQYDIVLTNPPYLNKYDETLKSFIKTNYANSSADLFSAFIVRCLELCREGGYSSMMTPNVWMFIKSYEELRKHIINHHAISTLVQMAKGAFYSDATVDVCAFVLQNGNPGTAGFYVRLEDFKGNMDVQRDFLLNALAKPNCPYTYNVTSDNYKHLPGMPIAYWTSPEIIELFKTAPALGLTNPPRQGLATTCNKRFLRHWFEVPFGKIGFGLDKQTAISSNIKWFPYNKGGEFRKWYGNQDYVVNYQFDGREIKQSVLTKYPYLKNPNFVVKNADTYFQSSLSWSKVSSGSAAFRYFPQGFLYDVSGCSIFYKDEDSLLYHAAFLNSVVCAKMLEMISPTLNYETGHIAILPVPQAESDKLTIIKLVKENIDISREDWNECETSWDFQSHPMLKQKTDSLETAFNNWKALCNARFSRLKSNEETLNRIFIDISGLQNQINPNIDDKSITVHRFIDSTTESPDASPEIANLDSTKTRRKQTKQHFARTTKDAIISFISYAVGCVLGRYSLSVPGIIYDQATQKSSNSTYSYADQSGIAPITTESLLDTDLTNRFISFVKTAFGCQTLDANLAFIANALEMPKGSPRERINTYMMNHFYNDHLKLYQNCPIYWQFDASSGSNHKKNSFKCLAYIHRFEPNTIARIRTTYVLPLLAIYDRQLSDLNRCTPQSPSEQRTLNKRRTTIEDKLAELRAWEHKLHQCAQNPIQLDPDNGIQANYEQLSSVLTTI